jgi:hypothetical protein
MCWRDEPGALVTPGIPRSFVFRRLKPVVPQPNQRRIQMGAALSLIDADALRERIRLGRRCDVKHLRAIFCDGAGLRRPATTGARHDVR